MADAALAAALTLEGWLGRHGLAGYDPYDVRGTPVGRGLHRLGDRGGAFRIPRKLLAEADELMPMVARRALRVAPKENAHAFALVARAECHLLDLTGEAGHGASADAALEWLLEHAVRGPGLGWGYPFDWQTGVLVPAETPSGFVSLLAGDAFLARAAQTGDTTLTAAASAVADFLLHGLNVTELEHGLSFSYTPLDDFQVNNVNLLVAEYLTRVAGATGRTELAAVGRSAAALTLREFREDGALPYWRREQEWRNPGYFDHYHQGNALRALLGLWVASGDDEYRRVLDCAFAFYRESFFEGPMPLTYPNDHRLIDVHACAEALHASAALSGVIEDARDLLHGALAWTLANLQRADGAFAYRIRRRHGRQRRSDVAYVRWGQAPMLLGLAAAAKATA